MMTEIVDGKKWTPETIEFSKYYYTIIQGAA